jgi:hypothetical protein
VATHAGNAPFRGRDFEAYVPHYADYFATYHAIMLEGEGAQPSRRCAELFIPAAQG